jgi:hypothetical protein
VIRNQQSKFFIGLLNLRKISFLISIAILLVVGCQPRPMIGNIRAQADTPSEIATASLPESPPQKLSGEGPGRFPIEWEGSAIIQIQIGKGSSPYSVSIQKGLETQRLVEGEASIDEYRGYEFGSSGTANIVIEGERSWKIQILPVSSHYFKSLHIPGVFEGDGNAVILLDGKHGVATFDTTRSSQLEAWAYGPDGEGGQLYIKPDGDYKGKSVLPLGAGWIIVSASGQWSVDVQGPCCELIR